MKFSKHEIQQFLESDSASGYVLFDERIDICKGCGYINLQYKGEITVDIDLVNEMPAYIYEPSTNSWEICDTNGRDGKPDSERYKLNDKLTAFFEKQNLEQQIAKQPETPKMKFKM